MSAEPQPRDNPVSGRRLRLTPTAAVSLALLAILALAGLASPLIAPYSESEILTDESFLVPGGELLLGGDFLGRDILSRMIYGTRVTLGVALAIAVLSFFGGITLGFLAIVFGGYVDIVVSRFIDALISIPSIMLALIVVTALNPSIPVLIVTVAFIDATRVFRVARALAMDIVVQDYLEVAKLRGEGLAWIIRREILPNAFAPLAAEFGIRFTYAILFISALSFLGLGVQPPHADLGVMIRENMQGVLYGSTAPLFPAIAIASITISVNMVVDWYIKASSAHVPDQF